MIRTALALYNYLLPSPATGYGLRGRSHGTRTDTRIITKIVKGTPIFRKSDARYPPGVTTNKFAADDTGDIKADDDARATVMAKGYGDAFMLSAIINATGAIRIAVAVLEINIPIKAVARNTAASNPPLPRPVVILIKN